MRRAQAFGGSSPSASVDALQRLTAPSPLRAVGPFSLWVTDWVTSVRQLHPGRATLNGSPLRAPQPPPARPAPNSISGHRGDLHSTVSASGCCSGCRGQDAWLRGAGRWNSSPSLQTASCTSGSNSPAHGGRRRYQQLPCHHTLHRHYQIERPLPFGARTAEGGSRPAPTDYTLKQYQQQNEPDRSLNRIRESCASGVFPDTVAADGWFYGRL
jgi:hypothetical protein